MGKLKSQNLKGSWRNIFLQRFFVLWLVMIGTFFCCLGNLGAQNFQINKDASNTSPNAGETFDYIIGARCVGSQNDCESAIITDPLPGALEFLNFSYPLPDGVSPASYYDANTHTVHILFDGTPPACNNCTPDGINTDNDDFVNGSTVEIRLQVRFHDSSFTGTQAENTAYGTSNNAGNPQDDAPTVTVQNGVNPQYGCNQLYTDLGSENPVVSGNEMWTRTRFGNLGLSTINNLQIINPTPANTTLDQVRTPEVIGSNLNGQLYYELSNAIGTWNLWGNFNTSVESRYYSSGLSLPPGVEISSIRMNLDPLSGDGTWNPWTYPSSWDSSMRIYYTVDTGLLPGTNINICSAYSSIINGVNCTENPCITADVAPPGSFITGGKSIQDLNGNDATQFAPGDLQLVDISFASDPTNDEPVLGGVIVDILPPGVTYVSHIIGWGHASIQNENPQVQTSFLPDGRQLVRFVWHTSFSNEFVIQPLGWWEGFSLEMTVQLGTGMTPGWYNNELMFSAANSDHTCNWNGGWGDIQDTNNYLGGYASSGSYCFSEDDFEIVIPPGSAGLESEKAVLGTLDANPSRYPNTGTTVPGGLNNYTITLDNPNATPIDEIVIIDVFPYIGDTEVLSSATPRSSAWRPVLAAPIAAPSGTTVYYSTANNPCRDELATPSDPLPFPTGCNPAAWTTTPPADLTTVTAIKLDLGSTVLNQGDTYSIDLDMRAPINVPTNGSIAWNSFAYIGTNADTGDELLAAEPIKVGIVAVPPTGPIVGNFVWDDLDGNGLQDLGEPGINGVRVNLYEDSNGDGIFQPGTDNLETYTITSAGGLYQFSDYPPGDYFIQFSNFPSGYNITHTDVGADDSIDSDGPLIPISVNTSTDDKTYDLGLYNGTPPSLCDLEGGITAMSTCEILNTNNGFEDSGTAVFNQNYNGISAALLPKNSTAIPGWYTDFSCQSPPAPCPDAYILNDTGNQINNPEGDKFIVFTEDGYCLRSLVNLTAGECYNLSFWVAFYNNGSSTGMGEATISTIDNSQYINLSNQNIAASTNFNNMNWQLVTATFTPTTTKLWNFYFSLNREFGAPAGVLAVDGLQITPCCDEACHGGSVDLYASAYSSNLPLTYLWDDGSTGPSTTVSPTGLATAYRVTVTDALGCTYTDWISIDVVYLHLEGDITKESCYGEGDGSITLTGSDGVAPYTYTLDGHGTNTTGVFNNLAAGYYGVTLTDANGCILPGGYNIDGYLEPMACIEEDCDRNITGNWSGGAAGPWSSTSGTTTVNLSVVHDTNTDVINTAFIHTLTTADPNWFVDGAAGMPALRFEYLWDTNHEPQYTDIDVPTDDKGTATFTLTFNEPVNDVVLHIDRLGGAGGVTSHAFTNSSEWTLVTPGVTMTKLSGTSDFEVTANSFYRSPDMRGDVFQPEATYTTLDGTAAGSLGVISANPITSLTFQVTGKGIEGGGNDAIELAVSSSVCEEGSGSSAYYCDQAQGSASVSALNGTHPYTYLWDNGETTSTATSLDPGSHDVTVTDANGCEVVCAVVIDNEGISRMAGVINAETCDGDNDGSISITGFGGLPPYTYSLTGQATNSSGVFNNLSAGFYLAIVTDSHGCTLERGFNVPG